MALTSNHANNELIKFRSDVGFDYLRSSRFDPYMGGDSTSIFVRLSDLSADGKEIRIPLVTQMTGDGVGTGTLSGAEEQIDSYGFPMWADWARNAVKFNKNTAKESSFAVRETARKNLRGWAKRIVRDDLVDALLAIPSASIQSGRGGNPGNRVNGIKWSAATAGNKNTWVTANSDRVLFGSAVSNYSTTFATAAANVDSTNDKLTAATLMLAKEVAQQTGVTGGTYTGKPKINPWMIEGLDEEYYVMFVGSRAMRDLRNDATMYQANRDARAREANPEKTNPIFTGGALLYNGVIVKEIPEITQRLLLTGVGAASIDVEPYFLCGQGAYAYGFNEGLGIEAQHGVGKIAKSVSGSLVDWGVVTGFVSGVASA
jgi:N4-gp56 family major capsid protein